MDVILPTASPWLVKIDGENYPVPSTVGRLLLSMKEEIDMLRKRSTKEAAKKAVSDKSADKHKR